MEFLKMYIPVGPYRPVSPFDIIPLSHYDFEERFVVALLIMG
jgi:hypothetical protein